MKYEVIQDFKGSPDGHTVIQFTKGSEIDHEQLGDDLAEVALAEKWVKHSKAAEKEAKAKAKAEAERIAALQAEIAQLEADYQAAAETDKAVIQTAWETKSAELAAL